MAGERHHADGWTAINSMRHASRPATTAARKQSFGRSLLETPTKTTTKPPPEEEPHRGDDSTAESALFRMVATRPMRVMSDGTSHLTVLLGSAEEKLGEQLLIASEKGKKYAVYLLLHQGLVNRDRCRGMRGYTPLHHAATRGHLDVLQLLVEFGWHVDTCSDAMETPLHLASFSGHVPIVEFLLDKGANVNAVSCDGETALFFAARKNHNRIVRLLIRHECDLTVKNRYGDVAQDEATSEKTLLEFAVGHEDIERLYRPPPAKPSRGASFRGEVTLTQKHREVVLGFLDLTSLCRASQACYRWYRASDSPALWRHLGVSRWELSLQTSVGLGAVSPMSLLGAGSLQLNMSSLLGGKGKSRRPSSSDQVPNTGINTSDSRRLSLCPRNSVDISDLRRPQTARAAGLS